MEALVVDDDFFTRNLLTNMLEKLGHHVTAAEDGQEALEIMKGNDIRIVITDWMMPGLDGLELCRSIRDLDKSGYVFIILLTAKDSKQNIVAGLESGADDYLCKPFNKAEFIARLKCGLRILNLETSLKKANEKVRLLSITDDLTGCFNKRYLEQHFYKEIDRAKRFDHKFCIIMTDIDHFKQVNDTYGHPAGDRVLQTFAHCLNRGIRKNIDWVVRYGGEEFLIVLPETSVSAGVVLANRLRQLIENEIISNKSIQITASFGVAGFEACPAQTKEAAKKLIKIADECLYNAKESGRNKVCCIGD